MAVAIAISAARKFRKIWRCCVILGCRINVPFWTGGFIFPPPLSSPPLHTLDGIAWNTELLFQGNRERLGLVLMTALLTGLGLVTIVIGGQQAGREIEGPMAIVILCGLVTSTLLNLLVLPSIACLTVNGRPLAEIHR